MKAQRSFKDPPMNFRSFDIVLTVESVEEAQALYAIFNYVPNIALLPEGISTSIKKAIGEKFGISWKNHIIARGITYQNFYRSKKTEEE